jgi:hypothetical protein
MISRLNSINKVVDELLYLLIPVLILREVKKKNNGTMAF